MSRTRRKLARRSNNVRLLKIVSARLEGADVWDTYQVTCPRRGVVGLEVCLECRLSGRMLLDQDGVPVRLGCGLEAGETELKHRPRLLTLVR